MWHSTMNPYPNETPVVTWVGQSECPSQQPDCTPKRRALLVRAIKITAVGSARHSYQSLRFERVRLQRAQVLGADLSPSSSRPWRRSLCRTSLLFHGRLPYQHRTAPLMARMYLKSRSHRSPFLLGPPQPYQTTKRSPRHAVEQNDRKPRAHLTRATGPTKRMEKAKTFNIKQIVRGESPLQVHVLESSHRPL